MKNLLIITPDQMRADYLGCYGNKQIRTPNIDALAKSGVQFDNCYCASPLCAPSRISFATSTYVGEHGHRQYWSEINPDVPNLVSTLKNSGYRTGMFGKNHLFHYSRLNEVWDELDEICVGNYDDHPEYIRAYDSFTMQPEHRFNLTARLSEELIQFVSDAKQPFLGWVNYQDPHPAFTCPPPYDTMYNPADAQLPDDFNPEGLHNRPQRCNVWRRHSVMEECSADDMRRAIAYYMGQISYVDDCVGRIVDALRQQNLLENTVILFFSDHGELLGNYGMTHKLPVFYDCLTRIPTILAAPGLEEGLRCKGLVEEVDLAPTLLGLLGVPIPATMVGIDWSGELPIGEDEGRESVLCEAGGGAPTCKQPVPGMVLKAPHAPTSFGPGAMLRKGDWKLSVYTDDTGELYHLADDPQEVNNWYYDKSKASVRAELTEDLLKRLLAVKVRDVGINWDASQYPVDVRFEPLEG